MGPLTTEQLSRYVIVKQPTFSYHMNALRDAHLMMYSPEHDAQVLDASRIAMLDRYVGEVLDTHMPRRY